jgi:hypothetical protein
MFGVFAAVTARQDLGWSKLVCSCLSVLERPGHHPPIQATVQERGFARGAMLADRFGLQFGRMSDTTQAHFGHGNSPREKIALLCMMNHLSGNMSEH